MRSFYSLALAIMLGGCAAGNSVLPPINELSAPQAMQTVDDGNHMLWGEWEFFIDSTHENIDVVPKRAGRFHLNALKFLEEYCTNCLKVTNTKNNGDSTIDLTVQIRHPFPGHPEYTGFDVKGIIMFNGSWTKTGFSAYPPWPEPFRVSWRNLGDPQLLNTDGYTLRWSPSYDSGSTMPIFNYWEGKYANGTPTANLNGYLNFYTDENRHMFSHDGAVYRTYEIWLPPGQPVIAGYAVEALWEMPTVMPVTNPAVDFPLSANQSEPYEFYIVLNEGNVITDPEIKCCSHVHEEIYARVKQWGGVNVNFMGMLAEENDESIGHQLYSYAPDWPDDYGKYYQFPAWYFPDGEWIGVGIAWRTEGGGNYFDHAYTVFEFTKDYE
ncbi:MAG TPA: hypothetical protein VGB30_02800 [bacterium]|jgi:hypothetical protein